MSEKIHGKEYGVQEARVYSPLTKRFVDADENAASFLESEVTAAEWEWLMQDEENGARWHEIAEQAVLKWMREEVAKEKAALNILDRQTNETIEVVVPHVALAKELARDIKHYGDDLEDEQPRLVVTVKPLDPSLESKEVMSTDEVKRLLKEKGFLQRID